jgi:DNA-binding transcriptional LysR family regulator
MHFKGLDLNLLVVLDALLVERSTTRAGERLYLSQSATSGALARLREYFGDPLLIRGPQNKMALTPLAESLAGPVRSMLSQAETVLTSNAAFDPATSDRRFRLNMGDEVATALMPAVLERVRKTAPRVKVEILSYNPTGDLAPELAEVLEKGDLDFLIAPKAFASVHHPMELLLTEHFVCVAWAGNLQLGDTISEDQFYSMGHVATRLGPRTMHLAEEELTREFGEGRRVEVVAPNFGLKATFLIGTDLIATMQESLAHYCARYLPLKVLPLPVYHAPVPIFIQWHRYQDHDPGTRWLLSILKECASSIYRSQSNDKKPAAAKP